MITQESVNQAELLGSLLNRNGVYVEPVPGTPLYELNKVLAYGTNGFVNGNISEVSNVRRADNTNEHGELLDELLKVIGNSVADSEHRARNVVMPMVKDVYAKLLNEIDQTTISAANPVTIVINSLPTPFNNPTMVSLVSSYKDQALEAIRSPVMFPVKSIEELNVLVKTGIDHLDAEVEELLSASSEGAIQDAWNAIFLNSTYADSITDLFNAVSEPQSQLYAMFAFLFSRKLLKEEPLDVKMSAAEYRLLLTNIMVQSARAICRAIDIYEKQITTNVLVVRYPAMSFQYATADNAFLRVNGAVYNQWLEKGGCPEILFGAYITDREMTAEGLLEKKDQYLEAWVRQDRLVQSRIRSETFSRSMSALRKVLLQEIRSFDTAETAISKEVLEKEMLSLLGYLNERDLKDLMIVVRNLVCDIFFKHTDAKMILEKIDLIGEANPTMDVREVALHEAIDYVGMWMVKLMRPYK